MFSITYWVSAFGDHYLVPRGPSLFAMGGNLPRWQFKNGSTAPIELGAEVVPFYHAWDRSLGCHVFYAR